ncbi:MAG: hypothetical protein GAK30_03792 [Paracidovorax wautersii]|uniref:Antibiotic biosynthesis monooxygenase n=1 Tax=Paracidovorax wautersii TaxID=1177982 RepID=A0A7V8FKK6_9BURK|nr:MAG: hypothetical protein GAK30_03792 [Paracidovorax wautersii]
MYTSTFTFAQGDYDTEFRALNRAIAQIARAIPGYLDEETWENAAAGLISNVYYWESMPALEQFLNDPGHLQPQHTRTR